MAKNIDKNPVKIKFLIDHIDPLGQGVYKSGEDIYFIPKTLPGETGLARVVKSKKNIHFCVLDSLEQKSPKRITPLCPHFENCPGCHFLHTDYESELEFKAKSFERMLAPIASPDFSIVTAPERLSYRNRIQLHYAKRVRKLGFIQGKQNRILEVPGCKIFRPELQNAFNDLYQNWNKSAKRPKGHVEIYLGKDGAVKTSWDQAYASGGFTQVNREMNARMVKSLANELSALSYSNALDLFGGDGNLAAALGDDCEVTHIDIYDGNRGENFHSHNLMLDEALGDFAKKSPSKSYDLFLVDPPRSGFKLIDSWIEHFRPKYLAYISCHPQTMVRDIKSIQRPFKILDAKLLDLFPSTFHFEAMTLIELE